ncbi:MAG: arginine N-succinyltransferase [Phycisphaeraceae bacterium]|nr:arginine N-succinyltransferase [Phycisphaerales bacterium]MCB9858851.1 arginine N-succinyltransferase [Phycisphaeraceae bacterium]
MFVIRRPKLQDTTTLLKLAKMVYFINLPPDKDIIGAKISHARKCFEAVARGDAHVSTHDRKRGHTGGYAIDASELFMFCMEDLDSGAVIGTSQIIAQMGGPGNPSVSLKLSRKEFFSKSLQTGTMHTVARLHLDESGPSEIGGLIMQPSFRRHKLKLGRFMGLVRFHFVGLHRARFRDRVLAEMMAPITADGQNLLWDFLGRRFINLSYSEADRFCQTSREFMTSLLPDTDIYLSLLPPEARALVSEVGPETVPARKMLEKLGFAYRDLVDPFDGGPYLDAVTNDISIVKATSRRVLGNDLPKSKCKQRGMVSVLHPDGEFFAVETECAAAGAGKPVSLPRAVRLALKAEPGCEIGFTPEEIPTVKKSSGRSRTRS